jgi:hypothetical protein
MDDVLTRIWEHLQGRIGGPLSFRLLLQPLVASILAVRAGLHDARAGHAPYFWSILTRREERRDLLREGWKAVAKVFLFAVAIDAAYQWMVFRFIYLGELLLVAFLLACVPYLLIRGTATRLADRRRP